MATASFTVLTGASDSARLEVRGNVGAHFRTAYDILVRPPGAVQPVERDQGLVQQNFVSGIFGGISMEQYREIKRTSGVQVAAPLAVFGFVMPSATIPVSLGGQLPAAARTAFRVETRWTADRGHVHVRDPDSYVYVTRHRLAPAPPPVIGVSTRAQAGEDLGDEGIRPVCPVPTSAASAFASAARSSFACWSTQTGRNGYGDPRGQTVARGASVDFPFPVLVAGIDPAAEAALSGIDDAVVSGRYLRKDDGPVRRQQRGFPRIELPVLAASSSDLDLSARVRVRRLSAPTGAAVAGAGADRGAVVRALRRGGAGVTVATQSVTATNAYNTLLGELRDSVMLDATWRTGPPQYAVRGPRHLVAQPIHSDPYNWGSALGVTGTDTGFVNAPPTAHGLGFRRLYENIATKFENTPTPTPTLHAVGTFDPRKLAGFEDPDVSPLNAFHAPAATGADAASRRALGDQPLAPDGNMAGYLTPPPLLLTTIAARSTLLDPRSFGTGVESQQATPISSVRVRVAGVTGADATSRERVRVTAERIAAHTGLAVDITAGSSALPVTVDLPASGFGRPALSLRETWIKKGVATAILTAVDRKSLMLFLLVLLVCVLFCANATSAAVRSRAQELGVLACVGWSRRKLFAYQLTEVGIVGLAAGIAGTLVALPAGALLDLPVSGARTLVAAPAAVLLALLAGIWPTLRASRSDPMEAVRPAVRSTRSAHSTTSIAGMALTNLLRVPGRSALAAISLGVGIFTLTVLLSVTFAFRGAVVGTVLGDAVAVQVRTADYVAVAATLVLGALACADVLYLNLRDRSAEIATLRATGWRERHLTRLVALEGAGLGVVGAVAGALLGLGAAAALAGAWSSTIAVVAVGDALLGVVIAVLASLPPAALLRHLPTATLLAEE
ncbi:MAG TPA: ABC transporter permease [Baekduia sp.]|nr:ABC transporter permease [Baekduia sp.]